MCVDESSFPTKYWLARLRLRPTRRVAGPSLHAMKRISILRSGLATPSPRARGEGRDEGAPALLERRRNYLQCVSFNRAARNRDEAPHPTLSPQAGRGSRERRARALASRHEARRARTGAALKLDTLTPTPAPLAPSHGCAAPGATIPPARQYGISTVARVTRRHG